MTEMGMGFGISEGMLGLGGGPVSYSGFPATDADFGWRTDDSVTDGSGYDTLYDITGNGNDASRPDAAGAPAAYGTLLDGHEALVCSNGDGLNLTNSVAFNGMFDVFYIGYITGVRNSMFTTAADESKYLFSKEAYWRSKIAASLRTLWNSPPDNSWQAIRFWRDASNNMRVSVNGAADQTPGDKIYADTGTMDRLLPHDLYYSSGPLLEIFGLKAANFTGVQLTAAYSYINSRYPTLGVTIP